MDRLDYLAKNLLLPIWIGIAREYKKKYSLNIWKQFEDNIRSAAYTSSLTKFLDALFAKLGVELEKKYVEQVHSILNEKTDREYLNLLRKETTTLVLIVRLENEKIKNNKKELAKEKNLEIEI